MNQSIFKDLYQTAGTWKWAKWYMNSRYTKLNKALVFASPENKHIYIQTEGANAKQEDFQEFLGPELYFFFFF